jgi:hypothetical protein
LAFLRAFNNESDLFGGFLDLPEGLLTLVIAKTQGNISASVRFGQSI